MEQWLFLSNVGMVSDLERENENHEVPKLDLNIDIMNDSMQIETESRHGLTISGEQHS